jgi:hypothetical protein
VPDYRLDDRGSIPGRGKRIPPLASVFWPALRPTQPPVKWIPRVLSPRVKRHLGVTLTTHPHWVQRSRISRSAILPLPGGTCMVIETQPYFFHYRIMQRIYHYVGYLIYTLIRLKLVSMNFHGMLIVVSDKIWWTLFPSVHSPTHRSSNPPIHKYTNTVHVTNTIYRSEQL